MHILVTGAAGRVGSAVARELLEHGHQLRLLDQLAVAPDLRERCEVAYLNLNDRLGLLRAVEGIEGVAHLGAVPNPGGVKDVQIFETNVLGTQYLLAACEAHDVKRFVFASSNCIYGFPFQRSGTLEPLYLPMNEEHPQRPEDLYGLSKALGEQTCATYTRRTGMTTICLRLTWVMNLDREKQNSWFSRRHAHAHEHKSAELWSYVDRRDAARAFRLSLEQPVEGHHALNIFARDLIGSASARERIEKHYPHLLPFLDNGFPYDEQGFWDTSRAEEVIGWKSEIHWRDMVDAGDE